MMEAAMAERHEIWNNDVCAEYDWMKKSGEYDFDDDTDYWRAASEQIDIWREDEFGANLDVDLENDLIATAAISRWTGTYPAYLPLETSNIGKAVEKVLGSFDSDSTFHVFVEGGELIVTQTGHDNPVNPSRIVIKMITDPYEDDPDGNTPSDTKAVADAVSKVFGW
jgi:hypothetical protein